MLFKWIKISFTVRTKKEKVSQPLQIKQYGFIKKAEKALPQADFSKNPVISFSVLRAKTLSERCSGRIYFFTIHFSLFTKLVRECFLEVITHKIQYRLKLSSQKQKLLPTKRQGFYYTYFLFTEGCAYKT